MSIKWTDDLSTGVKIIDEQHKELIEKIRNFIEASSQRKGKEELSKMIEYLGQYIQKHFSAEEAIMKKHNYPGYESHREQHQFFIREFFNMKKELTSKGPSVSLVVKLNHFITRWFIDHVRKTDRKLGEYLRNQSP